MRTWPDGVQLSYRWVSVCPWTNNGQHQDRLEVSPLPIWNNTLGTKRPGQGLPSGLITQRSRVQIPSPRRSKRPPRGGLFAVYQRKRVPAAERANVFDDDGRVPTVHDLRHTAISLLYGRHPHLSKEPRSSGTPTLKMMSSDTATSTRANFRRRWTVSGWRRNGLSVRWGPGNSISWREVSPRPHDASWGTLAPFRSAPGRAPDHMQCRTPAWAPTVFDPLAATHDLVAMRVGTVGVYAPVDRLCQPCLHPGVPEVGVHP